MEERNWDLLHKHYKLRRGSIKCCVGNELATYVDFISFHYKKMELKTITITNTYLLHRNVLLLVNSLDVLYSICCILSYVQTCSIHLEDVFYWFSLNFHLLSANHINGRCMWTSQRQVWPCWELKPTFSAGNETIFLFWILKRALIQIYYSRVSVLDPEVDAKAICCAKPYSGSYILLSSTYHLHLHCVLIGDLKPYVLLNMVRYLLHF